MSLYSFLVAVRSDGQQLMNETGETTSHLMGMFYRTLRIVDNGIKPLYVFDGAPPKLKSGELAKRFQRKTEAQEQHEEMKEIGTAEEVEKFSRRTVRVTKEHNAEAQRLLKLMGIPYIVAPTEAEAQCAVLARAGKVYAAASEDMDTLTFNSPVLLRHLTFSEQRKEPIQEIHLDKVLEGFGMTMEQVSTPRRLELTDAGSSSTSASSLAATTSIPSRALAQRSPSTSSRSTSRSRTLSSSSTKAESTRSPRIGRTRTHDCFSSSQTSGPPMTSSATSSGMRLTLMGWSSFWSRRRGSTRTVCALVPRGCKSQQRARSNSDSKVSSSRCPRPRSRSRI